MEFMVKLVRASYARGVENSTEGEETEAKRPYSHRERRFVLQKHKRESIATGSCELVESKRQLMRGMRIRGRRVVGIAKIAVGNLSNDIGAIDVLISREINRPPLTVNRGA